LKIGYIDSLKWKKFIQTAIGGGEFKPPKDIVQLQEENDYTKGQAVSDNW